MQTWAFLSRLSAAVILSSVSGIGFDTWPAMGLKLDFFHIFTCVASSLLSKATRVSALTAFFDNQFHMLATQMVKKCFLNPFAILYCLLWVMVSLKCSLKDFYVLISQWTSYTIHPFTQLIIAGSLGSAYSLNWGAQEIWGKGGGETLALLW